MITRGTETTPVWVLEQHPLAARYLLQMLGRDPTLAAQWVRGDLPRQGELGLSPLFIIGSEGLEIPIAQHIQDLNRHLSDARYIVVDRHTDGHDLCQLLLLGLRGFVTYDEVIESLITAVHSVQDGAIWVDSQTLQKYLHLGKREKTLLALPTDTMSLTVREEDIWRLARQRLSNREIALQLNVKVSTVKFHLSNIFSKLHIVNRSALWTKLPLRVGVPVLSIDNGSARIA